MKLLLYRGGMARLMALATLALGIAAAGPAAQAEDITKAYTVSGRPNVRVDTNDGSVTVTPATPRKCVFAWSTRAMI